MNKLIHYFYNILHKAKRLVIAFLKGFFYCIMWLRLRILKFKHDVFIKKRGIKSLINCDYHKLTVENLKHSLFVWETNDASVHNRVTAVIIGFILIFLIIAAKLIIVTTGEYINFSSLADRKIINRIDITDRNNNLLAVNLPGASIYVNPKKILDPEEAVAKLISVIPSLDRKKTLSQLKSKKHFVWIKRDITPLEHQQIYNLGIPGLEFEREQKRIYTYGNLLSHVVGFVGRDMQGLAGVEQYFEKFLTGRREMEDRTSLGSALRLSIDVRVQNILSEEIEKTMRRFSAKGAAGIIADPNTGEILALVSKPDFDPHNPGSAKPEQLFNMATQGVYEMGSGMKSLTMAIGLDTDTTALNDAYDLSYMKVSGFQVKDYHAMRGWHSVPHIFLKSSNVGVSQIMLEIGKKLLLDYLKKLKLLEPLEIELPERSRPLFPSYARWTDLSLTTMSYGYGISVSPLHFVQSMIPMVNGGIAYPLTLIKRNDISPLIGERIFKEETSSSMKKLMRLAVSEGTGSKAEVPGYYVGGKTGTANIAYAGKYDKNRRISSFFGIIPASNPRFIIYIVFNEPVGIKETFGFAGGGWTAAPTVGAVFKRVMALYGIRELDPSSSEVTELNNIEYKIRDET